MANADNTHIRDSAKVRTHTRINTMSEARAKRYAENLRHQICKLTNERIMRARLDELVRQ